MGSDNDEDDSEVESSVKDEHELSIGSQGLGSASSPPSWEFIPSVSQVWSSPISSPDGQSPPSEFRDWHPTSQISQFLNDLNHVPRNLEPLNILEYHEKEDLEGGEDAEQCNPENSVEELAFHEVSFPDLDPSQELPDDPGQSTPVPHSLSRSPSSFQHRRHQGRGERARKKALQISKEINVLSSLRARLMRKHRKLVMISHLHDSD